MGLTQSVLSAGFRVAAVNENWGGFSISKNELHSDEVSRRCSSMNDSNPVDSESFELDDDIFITLF